MTRLAFASTWGAVLLSVAFIGGVFAQEQAGTQGGRETTRDTSADIEVDVDVGRAGETNLNQQLLAAGLIVQHDQQITISEFAAQQAHDSQVQEFAETMMRQHGEFIAKLHKHGLAMDATQPQVGRIVQDLANPIEKRGDASVGSESSRRHVLGFRGTLDETAAGDRGDGRSGTRAGLRLQREEIREGREDVREEREELREKRQSLRQDRRENARRVLRDALIMLRDNLPDILEVVGVSIESDRVAETGTHWIELKRQLAERHAETIKNELGRKEGWAFDHAYLQYEVLAHLEMIDTLTTIQPHATGEFHSTLQEGLDMTESHLQESRDLIDNFKRSSDQTSAAN